MSAAMVVDEEIVRAIVDQVWESLLRAEALPWYGEAPEPGAVAAEITLAGDWNGSVRLSCDPATAEQMAAVMLDAEDEQLPTEDVHDAVGEIVNVIGGNVKGTLGGETALGLPQVGVTTSVPGSSALVSQCVVEWQGAPVTVEVFAADPATP